MKVEQHVDLGGNREEKSSNGGAARKRRGARFEWAKK